MIKIRGGSTYDGDAIHIHGQDEIDKMDEITSLTGTEYFMIEESVDPYEHKKILASNVTSGSTDSNAVHVNTPNEINTNTPPATSVDLTDIIITEDESDSFNKKAATFDHVKNLLFTMSTYQLDLSSIPDGNNYLCLMSTNGIDATYQSYNHFIMEITNITSGDIERYEIGVEIPKNVYGSSLKPEPIVTIKNIGLNNPLNFGGIVSRNNNNELNNASIWFFLNGSEFDHISTEIQIEITDMRDAWTNLGSTIIGYSNDVPSIEYVDYLPPPLSGKEIKSNVIKTKFFYPYNMNDLYGGYRPNIERGSGDTWNATIEIPPDLNELQSSYNNNIGIFAIAIPEAAAAIQNQEINHSLQWDNGEGTAYNYNSLTYSGILHDLSSYADKIWMLRIPCSFYINFTDFPQTMAALITHVGVVGKIHYLGIKIFYR